VQGYNEGLAMGLGFGNGISSEEPSEENMMARAIRLAQKDF